MVKIICKTLGGAVPTQEYSTPKGNSYLFHMNSPCEVKDAEDALHFLNAGPKDNKYFGLVGEKGSLLTKIREKQIHAQLEEATQARQEREEEAIVQEEVAAVGGPYDSKKHYGLSEEEYEEAVAEGTYDEVEAFQDTQKGKKEFDDYAAALWNINLNRSKKLENMKQDFWNEWKQLDVVEEDENLTAPNDDKPVAPDNNSPVDDS